jgi:hypothetical protein
VNARRWEIDIYINEDGSFNEKKAIDEGVIFTLIELHVNVDYPPYDTV